MQAVKTNFALNAELQTYQNYFYQSLLDLRTSWGTAARPAKSKVDLNHSFFLFLLDLFGLQSAMMDGATKYGLLWASAALKCMGRGAGEMG